MKLSPHFSLEELIASNKAAQLRIDNTPPANVVRNLQGVAEMLERIRSTVGRPIVISSGYRCPQLNHAVGGVNSSDHVSGQAADIQAPSFGTPYQLARLLAPLVSTLGIGQLILEGVKGKQWVHVSTSIPEKAVNRIITITDTGVRAGIQELP